MTAKSEDTLDKISKKISLASIMPVDPQSSKSVLYLHGIIRTVPVK